MADSKVDLTKVESETLKPDIKPADNLPNLPDIKPADNSPNLPDVKPDDNSPNLPEIQINDVNNTEESKTEDGNLDNSNKSVCKFAIFGCDIEVGPYFLKLIIFLDSRSRI
jgi:hypothetical protein